MEGLDLNINNYNLRDLLNLFKVDHDFDKVDLKKAKRMVLMTHPDKSNIDKKYFLFFSKAYKRLFFIYDFKQTQNTDFNIFFDAANVWGVDYDSSIDESNVIRSSVGVAMDVLTPIGPLNFSFAQPVTKKSSDKTETFRFNIGTTF